VDLESLDCRNRSIVGLLRKRQAIITVIKNSDDTSEPQTMDLDFMHNTKYAQPVMDRKIREVRGPPGHDDTNNKNKSMQEVLRSAGFTILQNDKAHLLQF
jgi:hypothetical protein